jgi:DNA-directed RNA polymerase subunit RPC12/RpoP
VPRLATFADLKEQQHTLGLYCTHCNRWGEADIGHLISGGRGNHTLADANFRCRDCGRIVEKQLRPPVPAIGSAVPYIQA